MEEVKQPTVSRTFLDRAIGWLSPRWGMERQAWRDMSASYKGGVPTRTSEKYGTTTGYKHGTASERLQLANGRNRGYDAYKNNPVARTLVQTETDNVIGDGLNFTATTSSPEFNDEVKDRYYDWLEKASVRQGMISGAKLQRMIWDRSRVAGDIGWILVARGSDSFIQIVQAENIATPDGKWNTPNLIDGIQFDQFGSPQTFHVLSWDEQSATKRQFIPVPARDFVYMPHLTDTNQARGETCFITIFERLAQLDNYIDGVALAAWMATVFGIIFKQKNAAKQLSLLDTLTDSQGQERRAIHLEGAAVKYIGTDEEVAQVQAQQPMHQTPDFIRALMRLVGMPFDMPLEVFARDMSTCNFASARIGLLPFYRACRIRQACDFIPRWSRTYRWWVSRERLRAPDDPKRFRSAFPSDFWSHDFLGNEWQYTDPVSDVQGDMLELDLGTKSPQMVIAERGRDPTLILKQRKEWADATKDLPSAHSTMTRDPLPDPTEEGGAKSDPPKQQTP